MAFSRSGVLAPTARVPLSRPSSGGRHHLAAKLPIEPRSSRTQAAQGDPPGSPAGFLRCLTLRWGRRLPVGAFLVVLDALRSVVPRQQPSWSPRRRCRGVVPRCREASRLLPSCYSARSASRDRLLRPRLLVGLHAVPEYSLLRPPRSARSRDGADAMPSRLTPCDVARCSPSPSLPGRASPFGSAELDPWTPLARLRRRSP